jgi:hypothetical protein
MNQRILGYDLVMTCGACPEQYDVFLDGTEVGYLRLRHGRFAASYPGVTGREVYASATYGDGIFEDRERLFQLTKAIQAIDKARIAQLGTQDTADYTKYSEDTLKDMLTARYEMASELDDEIFGITQALHKYN